MKKKINSRIQSLKPLLKDPVPAVRTAAAAAIEKLDATSCLEEVLETLKTGGSGARVGAIHALGEIGGETVLPPLIYCSKRPEVDIRSAAVEVLGKLAEPSTLPVLAALLDDDSPAVQGRAIAGLRNFQVPVDVIERLRRFLAAGDGLLEAEAALTLAVLKDGSSTDTIVSLLSSRHASTRQAAATSLSLIPLR